jgi:hypothetical protein
VRRKLLSVAIADSFGKLRGASMASSWGNSHTDRWEQGFAALSRFRKREGHSCPSRHHVEGNFNLGPWVSTQRSRSEFLPLKRKRRLDAIGFVWDWRDYRWEQGFAALLKFKRREGHTCVPIFHKEGKYRLGYWVSTQRRKRKIMSAERRARLNKISFVWNAYTSSVAYRPTNPRRLNAPDHHRPRA